MRRAVIIGAGPGGLATAVALTKIGFDVGVYESARELREIGSGLTLWPNAMRALESLGLGLADRVQRTGLGFDGIAMRTWKGQLLFSMPSSESANFGWSGALHRAELQQLLLEAFGSGGVNLGARCSGYDDGAERVTAHFADGSEAVADLLVGADGLRSAVRAQLVGEDRLRYAGYTVWRGVAKISLDEKVGVTTLGQGAQFGIFPMNRDRVYWFGCANAPEGEQDPPEGKRAELIRRFSAWHEPIVRLIEATDEDAIVRTDIYDRKPIECWTKGRVVLIGDAAHPSAPTLGQGACQALEDAAMLAKCLGENTEIVDALGIYNRRRAHRANSMTDQARMIGRVGQWENPFACWMRNQMIKMTPPAVRKKQLRDMFRFEL